MRMRGGEGKEGGRERERKETGGRREREGRRGGGGGGEAYQVDLNFRAVSRNSIRL